MGRRTDVEIALRALAPAIPDHEFGVVADRAMDSPGLVTAAPENAAWLALVAYVRHVFTDYDDLLDEGYDQDSARHFVLDDMTDVLGAWGVRRPIVADEVDPDET
ncbi:DUF2293 domain-containing protein [Chthonobacter albigriseus]|uniref:DUF2293 domain-containing protein n=1 Tax=Chthonobacter albigriseus TaxID=1683161 RepID=UPI0015EE4950|nr:DUF2293 domain-containing protein [Chthonobacter albigriseus]